MENSKLFHGLTTEEVAISKIKSGVNKINSDKDKIFLHSVKDVVLEPMFIFLVAASVIYFVAGQFREGIIMIISVFIVAGISFYQEYRSSNAINALRKIAAAKSVVMRNGQQVIIPAEEIVKDDILLLSEGEIVSADGIIVSANDLSLNESVITGEAFPVNKTAADNQMVYKGTLVTSGSAVIQVNAVGSNTMFGKISSSLREITVIKTPLQKQIAVFVRNMAWLGLLAFLLVVGFNYYQSGNFINSFMRGLTLAMSILPEEIPVAFTTFLALGAFRLLQNKVIVKQPQYVETLGAATVICTDKTGTLTLNSMDIEYLYDAANDISVKYNDQQKLPVLLIEYAMWASEVDPFDPMEKDIHLLYGRTTQSDKRKLFSQVHEYPISGRPPMMTHIFKSLTGETIIAAKGAPEAILQQSNLQPDQVKKFSEQSHAYARQGYRVLGVGKANWSEQHYPLAQQEFVFEFLGLLAFGDPPKENIKETIEAFSNAGIKTKMITGDYAETALAIAKQINLTRNYEVLTGDIIAAMENEALKRKVTDVDIFARMFPEAKLKVIEALKENGEIVAMTGDGVNDAPSLKAAHIGIAMGLRGSEVAKESAPVILADDDIGHMVQAIALGRKIYDNLGKAIQYIVSIHIPIILSVMLPLFAGWKFNNIFSPVHVIFLELIMGPTCSIIYENEPIEPGTMLRPPRKISNTFLSGKQLMISIVQGLMITLGCLGIGYYYLNAEHTQEEIRTVIFITLLFSNVFLTLVNRSFHYSFFHTIKYSNNRMFVILGITLACISVFLWVPFMQQLFGLTTIPVREILICLITAIVGTCWIEFFKRFLFK